MSGNKKIIVAKGEDYEKRHGEKKEAPQPKRKK